MSDEREISELPPMEPGLFRCPLCSAGSPVRIKVPSNWVIVFKPRVCVNCDHLWTPRPWRMFGIVYGAVGLFFFLGGASIVFLFPKWIQEWRADLDGFTTFRIIFAAIMGFGSVGSAILGVALLSAAKQIVSQKKQW